jgi:hypothetical protein
MIEYSLETTNKINSYKTHLDKKLKEFYKFNPFFGKRMIKSENFSAKTEFVFNEDHINFFGKKIRNIFEGNNGGQILVKRDDENDEIIGFYIVKYDDENEDENENENEDNDEQENEGVDDDETDETEIVMEEQPDEEEVSYQDTELFTRRTRRRHSNNEEQQHEQE